MPGELEIRETFRRFPNVTQHFWTWFTGKALPGQKPLIRHSWLSYLTITVALFFSGLLLSAIAIAHRLPLWWLAMLAGWVLTLWAARTMILVITHQCIHYRFSGSRQFDWIIGEVVTVLNVYQDAETFKLEHVQSHHSQACFGREEDPPVQSLVGLGFRPGMTTRQLWLRAWIVFISPSFYLRGFAERLKCNLVAGSVWRRIGFLAWAVALLSLPFWLDRGAEVLLLAFVVPVILLSQLSALLDRLGEHAWLTERDPQHGVRYYYAAATWARFCGAPVPTAPLRSWNGVLAWLRWSGEMLCYHLPTRLLVVVGDLPNHDFHHRYPATHDWMIAAYARQRDIDCGTSGGPPYHEVWGLGRAIHRMFEGLSRAPRMAQSTTQTERILHASLDC
ncbi:fatty acid desaturase (plasmid) [Rhizobium leguminosarum]